MATASKIDAALREIADRIQMNQKRLDAGKAQINSAVSDLTSAQSQYAGLVAEIEQAAVANPDNKAHQAWKAQKDLFVAEFVSLKTTATAMKEALAGV